MKMVYTALFTGIFLSACTSSSNPGALQSTGINNTSGKTPVKAANCIYESWKSIYPAAKILQQTVDFYIVAIPGANNDIAQAHVEPGVMLTAHVKLMAKPDANPQITQMVKECL